jgi:hypothetical protein
MSSAVYSMIYDFEELFLAFIMYQAVNNYCLMKSNYLRQLGNTVYLKLPN